MLNYQRVIHWMFHLQHLRPFFIPQGSAPSGPSAPGRSSGAAWRPRCGSRPGGGAGTRRAPPGTFGRSCMDATWRSGDVWNYKVSSIYIPSIYIYLYIYTIYIHTIYILYTIYMQYYIYILYHIYIIIYIYIHMSNRQNYCNYCNTII
jgi:hypothetical protein